MRKRAYGSWVMPAFKLLAKLKDLRGTVFDPFGHTTERKTERRLAGDYEALLRELAASLTPDNHALALEIAKLPMQIRGYGHVKMRNLARAKSREAGLPAAHRSPVRAAAADQPSLSNPPPPPPAPRRVPPSPASRARGK